MEISAVIATRNRRESLLRLLTSLNNQEYGLKEVVVVDASDTPVLQEELQSQFPALVFICHTSHPSVCHQRNRGIKHTTGTHVLLCDDDLIFPPEYLRELSRILRSTPNVAAISGLCLERSANGQFNNGFAPLDFRQLIWRFVFQLTVWGDVNAVQTNTILNPILDRLKTYYRRRMNTFSLAGWPLVTQVHPPLFRTSHFSLGGAVVRKDWLIRSPFDERLDDHGIGDNYGVALNFPEDQPIWVATSVDFVHDKSPENRLPEPHAYYRRTLALDYFMTRNERFSFVNRLWLVWSLIGSLVYHIFKTRWDIVSHTIRAMALVLTRRNPYLCSLHDKQHRPLVQNR